MRKFWPFLALLLNACSTPMNQCVPGQQSPCICSNSRIGSQRCQSDGTYGACICTTPDAGPDVAEVIIPIVDAQDVGPDDVVDVVDVADVRDVQIQDVSDVPVDLGPNCVDNDGDRYGAGTDCLGPDCNDNDPAIYPGAPERCNGLDDNCDNVADTDADGPPTEYCRTHNRSPETDTYEFPTRCIPANTPGGTTNWRYTTRADWWCQACRPDMTEPLGWACICWHDGNSNTGCRFQP